MVLGGPAKTRLVRVFVAYSREEAPRPSGDRHRIEVAGAKVGGTETDLPERANEKKKRENINIKD